MLGGGATSALAADGCANAEFRVGPSALLPDCRAYELVSPADKSNYTLTAPNNKLAYSSESGDQATFAVVTPLEGALNASVGQYIATREADGWRSRYALPEYCMDDQSGMPPLNAFWGGQSASRDFSVNIFRDSDTSNCDPSDHGGSDFYAYDAAGHLSWVTQNGQPKISTATRAWQANDATGRHIAFSTSEQLVMPLESGRVAGSGLYERAGNELRVVGLKTDGSLINRCGARIAGASSNVDLVGRMSDDARVIFFNSGSSTTIAGCSPTSEDGGQLYARIDASRTVLLSGSERTVPDTRRAPELMGATRDGRKAFFTSTEMLTDDATAGGGLYEYDLGPVLDGTASTGTLRFLTKTLTAAAANVQGRQLAGMSEDGSRVYFVATGVLHPDAPTSGSKLYVSDNGQIRFVVPFNGSSFQPAETISVSADGSKATGLYRPPGYTTNQVFLYALGNSVSCVSCVPDVTYTAHAALQELARPAHLGPRRNVTNDGQVFFQSPGRLVPRDINSREDVYQYRDGELHLLSGGNGTMDSFLVGTSATGRDAFIVTNDSLLPEDFDNGDQDMYVARIGGGFPQPTGAAAPCVGDACQSGVAGTPGVLLSGTTGYVGAGNIPAPAVEKKSDPASKVSLVKGSRTVRGSAGYVRVRVSGEGRVRTSGSGLRRSARTVKRSGTRYRIPVRLSSRAKRTLDRRGRVRVRVTVRFTPEEGKTRSKRVRMTFRKAKTSSSRSTASKPTSRSGERAAPVGAASVGKGGR